MSAPVTPGYRPRALVALWSCVAVGLSVQALATLPPGSDVPFAAWVVAQQFLRAAFWGLLTPWVLRFAARFPLRGPRRYLHLALHLAVCGLPMLAFWWLRVPIYLALTGNVMPTELWSTLLGFFNLRNAIDVVLYWSILIGGWVFELWQREQQRALNEAELRARLAQSELGALRQQVQPHFLFNTLNAVGALVRLDRKQEAIHTLSQLSALQRTLLESAGVPFVPLAQEIAFVQRYLDIERLRFGDRLRVEISCPPELREQLVPNLLLQPLVENAVKHGVARRAGDCRVELRVARQGDLLCVEVENDPPEEGIPASEGTGFGLRSVRQRLAHLYGAQARVTFDPHQAGRVSARLEFPAAASS